MKLRAKEITSIYLSKMEEILEFRAFTQYSYMKYNSAVDNGLKGTAIISPTGKSLNQDQIREKLIQYESGFLPKLSFQHTVSIFESWLFDILRYLLSDNNRLNKKRKIDVGEIITSSNIDEVFSKIIESELNEIKYKKPSDWFIYLNSFVNINLPTSEDINKTSEIKASRDILVHNEGICNSIYLEKSGIMARSPNGKELCFDHDYVFKSWDVLNSIITQLGNAISEKVDA